MDNRLLKGVTAVTLAAMMALASPVLARGGGGGGGGHGGGGFGGGGFGGGGRGGFRRRRAFRWRRNACGRLRRHARGWFRWHGRRALCWRTGFGRAAPSRMPRWARALPVLARLARQAVHWSPRLLPPSSLPPFRCLRRALLLCRQLLRRWLLAQELDALWVAMGQCVRRLLVVSIAVPHHCRDRHRAVPLSPGTG